MGFVSFFSNYCGLKWLNLTEKDKMQVVFVRYVCVCRTVSWARRLYLDVVFWVGRVEEALGRCSWRSAPSVLLLLWLSPWQTSPVPGTSRSQTLLRLPGNRTDTWNQKLMCNNTHKRGVYLTWLEQSSSFWTRLSQRWVNWSVSVSILWAAAGLFNSNITSCPASDRALRVLRFWAMSSLRLCNGFRGQNSDALIDQTEFSWIMLIESYACLSTHG